MITPALTSVQKLLQWLLVLVCLAGLAACQTTAGLTPAQMAVLKENGFQLTDEGWELGLGSKVLFGSNEARLTAESRPGVMRIGASLAQVGIHTLRVDGHTDDVGADAYNEALSLKRAQAVAAALADAGIPKEGIFARGMGKRHPVAGNDSQDGRAQNRRVSIVVGNQ